MNGADIIILVILALGVLQGFRQGLIVNLGLLVSLILGFVLARAWYSPVRHLFDPLGVPSGWKTIIAYLLVFGVVWGVLGTLVRALATNVRFIARLLLLGFLDRLAGAVAGLIEAALLVVMLLYLGNRAPNHNLHHLITTSRLGPRFLDAVPYLQHWFPHLTYH